MNQRITIRCQLETVTQISIVVDWIISITLFQISVLFVFKSILGVIHMEWSQLDSPLSDETALDRNILVELPFLFPFLYYLDLLWKNRLCNARILSQLRVPLGSIPATLGARVPCPTPGKEDDTRLPKQLEIKPRVPHKQKDSSGWTKYNFGCKLSIG